MRQFTKLQIRRGYYADFEQSNPVLAKGEPCYILDQNIFVIGDGQTKLLDLPNLNSNLNVEANEIDGVGNIEVAGNVTANNFYGDLDGPIITECKNESGADITAGTPVYISGYFSANNKPLVAPCDASNPATMPAIGLLASDLADGEEGHIHVFGVASHLPFAVTDGFSIGDTVYVANGGGLTNVRPTGVNELVQNIGRVVRLSSSSSQSQGKILVLGPGRTNDTPNAGSYQSLEVGDYAFPTTDGSSGQVLQTDGNGQLSFATATGGGGTFTASSDIVAIGSGSYSNWSPNVTANVLSITTTGDLTLNSLVSTYGNGEVEIYNVGNYVVFITNDVGSSTNSILTSTGSTLTIESQAGVKLIYDTSSSRWRAYKINSSASISTLIQNGDSNVSVTDSGTDGHIDFTTENTARWEITSNGHLLPSTDADYDIGSATRKVRDLYLDSNSLHIGAVNISESSTVTGRLVMPSCELTGHIIPDTNSSYDLGSAEYKIRHLYLSNNSIYMGGLAGENGNKIGVENDEIVFTNTDGITQSKPCLMPTTVPITPNDVGKTGQMAVDSTHLYICTDTNTWRRIQLDSITDPTFV